MSDLTCSEVHDAATEYALGILPAGEARFVAEHLSVCQGCATEIEEIRGVGDQLLDLVPDAEPPLGFDRKVLVTLHPRRTRWRPGRAATLASCAAAAAILIVALTLAALNGHGRQARPADLTATLRHGDRSVGTVYVGGHPTWVTMTVDDGSISGTFTCKLITRDGRIVTIGDFQVVDGRGRWSAPDPAAGSRPSGALLIAPDGTVLATGTFASD